MPGMNGLDATRQILAKHPEALVLMLSMHPEETLVRQALDAGARGYVLKNAVDLELGMAIRRVVAGETVLDSQLKRPESVLQGKRSAALTPRELEVLQMIVDGKSNKEIATRPRSERQHGRRPSREHDGCLGNSQDRRTGRLCHPQRAGKSSVNRRSFLWGMAGLASTSGLLLEAFAASPLAGNQSRIPVDRRDGSVWNSLPPQQRRLWRQVAAGNAWLRLRLPRLRRATAGRTFCW